jgi:hypothetical protein
LRGRGTRVGHNHQSSLDDDAAGTRPQVLSGKTRSNLTTTGLGAWPRGAFPQSRAATATAFSGSFEDACCEPQWARTALARSRDLPPAFGAGRADPRLGISRGSLRA